VPEVVFDLAHVPSLTQSHRSEGVPRDMRREVNIQISSASDLLEVLVNERVLRADGVDHLTWRRRVVAIDDWEQAFFWPLDASV